MTKSANNSTERPPIVAVLGHVDHGKSTLLDFIRKSNTVGKEAGGITQHIAAYEIERERGGDKKRITFIDTPGHAAFTAIRERGTKVADIAVLVVAADDGVKPQTFEALQQIRSAGTPFVVAINKIDKPTANLERAQATLMEAGVYLEKLGGDVPWAAVSAKTGAGVEELLDLILLVAEIEGFSGDAKKAANGYCLEAHRDQKRGLAATLVITDGTLKSGMAVLAGRAIAPVRILETTAGKSIKTASFSTPISLVGFDELPEVGASFQAFATKREAEAARPAPPLRAAPAAAAAAEGETFYLPLIVRADTQGSLDAIDQELAKVGNEHARVRIVHSGIGTVAEGDIKAAVAGAVKAAVVAFTVGTDPIAEALAQRDGIRIEHFDIIYKMTERVAELLETLRPERRVEEIVGRAKILKQFSARKGLTTLGGKVLDGYIGKRARVRVMRRDVRVGEGYVASLQTNKQDAERVEADREFGAQVEAEFEVAAGDILESIVEVTK